MREDLKNTDEQWIGAIPSEWHTRKLKYCVQLQTDHATNTDNYIGLENIESFTGHLIGTSSEPTGECLAFQAGDVLFGKLRPYLSKSFLPERNGCCSSEFLVMRPTAINARYLEYATLSPSFVLTVDNSTYGAKMPRANWSFVRNLLMPLPDPKEQALIVTYLDEHCASIDNSISRHQQIIEKLEEYRKSVITQAVTKGLNPNVEMAMTGNNRLPIIPKEWKLIRLPHIVDTRHPYALGDGDHGIIKTDMYKNHGIPYIRVQNLGWGTPLSIDNVVYISENDNMKIVNSTLQPNDVLFAKTGATIGKTAIVPETIPMSNTTSHVGKITVSPRYNPKYIFYVLSSEYGYHQMWIYASQKATRPELSLDDIKNFVLPIPKERQEQNNIVQYLDNVCEKILESIAQHKVIIEKLQEYKQSLIYNAVTGKIDCRTEGGEVQ